MHQPAEQTYIQLVGPQDCVEHSPQLHSGRWQPPQSPVSPTQTHNTTSGCKPTGDACGFHKRTPHYATQSGATCLSIACLWHHEAYVDTQAVRLGLRQPVHCDVHVWRTCVYTVRVLTGSKLKPTNTSTHSRTQNINPCPLQTAKLPSSPQSSNALISNL